MVEDEIAGIEIEPYGFGHHDLEEFPSHIDIFGAGSCADDEVESDRVRFDSFSTEAEGCFHEFDEIEDATFEHTLAAARPDLAGMITVTYEH